MVAERAVILSSDARPDIGEIKQIVKVLKQEIGIDLAGARLTPFTNPDPDSEPTERLAKMMVAMLEQEGEISPGSLERTTTYTVDVAGQRRIVGVVWAAESNV
jgi:hypothetical protein